VSVINGFEGELARVVTSVNGDVILYVRGGSSAYEPGGVEKKIKESVKGVKAVTSSLVTELMVSGPNGVAGAALEGLDFETVSKVTEILSRLVEGREPEGNDEIVVGKALADRIGVKVGDTIRLVFPFMGDSSEKSSDPGDERSFMTGAPKVIQAKVSGILKLGMHEYDSKFIFGTLSAVQSFLSMPSRATTFKIKLSPGFDPGEVSQKLNDVFGYPFRAKSWDQLNRNVLYAIQLEKIVIAIIMTIIIIVAAFNVVSTLMMMIHEKTKELSILKAMGLPRIKSFQLVSGIGLGIGLVGVVLGIVSGLLLIFAIQKTDWIHLPAEVYLFGNLPVTVKWIEVLLIAALALMISFMATLYPALKVALAPPIEGLRYE
jgi:lipoprotein-releasing system permease protein